jgi:hypothetical protein
VPTMPRSVPVLPALGAALACSAPRTVVTARSLVEEPTAHDGQRIVLVGTAENPRRVTPAEGAGYTILSVADGTARVPVLAWGTQPVSADDTVEVRGRFRTRLVAGSDTLPDTLEAEYVRVLRQAAQPPGTPVGPP